jgi:hypothetical protein
VVKQRKKLVETINSGVEKYDVVDTCQYLMDIINN